MPDEGVAPEHVPLFRRGGWYESLDRRPLPGLPDSTVGLAPSMVIRADAVRRPSSPLPAPLARQEVVERALQIFANETVSIGSFAQSPSRFAIDMDSCGGLPPALVTEWISALRDATRDARPTRQLGRVLVSLPSNTFTCLETVVRAVLEAEEVWVRPSTREPISAARFVGCLVEADWPADRIAFYPTESSLLVSLIEFSDRAEVFGGEDVARQIGRFANTTVHGPGRGCAFVPADADLDAASNWLLDLIARNSGRWCSNVCTVLTELPPQEFGTLLAQKLDGISLRPPDDRFPIAHATDRDVADRIARHILRHIDGGSARRLTSRHLLEDVDGVTFLVPTLIGLDLDPSSEQHHPLLAHESPFPLASLVESTPRLLEDVRKNSLFHYRYPNTTPAT